MKIVVIGGTGLIGSKTVPFCARRRPTMRSDISPGGTFPDYELPDHTSALRKLSDLEIQEYTDPEHDLTSTDETSEVGIRPRRTAQRAPSR